MENDLHARVQILAGLRCGRIGVSDRWDGSGGITHGNYLTPSLWRLRAADKLVSNRRRIMRASTPYITILEAIARNEFQSSLSRPGAVNGELA
jgi:hypothetical protein